MTSEGLEQHLLSVLVANERADLEGERATLKAQTTAMTREVQELEERVLMLLSTAKGNVLDDDKLIGTLNDSKAKSNEVEQKHEIAAAKEVEIDETRDLYRPLASLAVQIYFAVSELSAIERMYVQIISSSTASSTATTTSPSPRSHTHSPRSHTHSPRSHTHSPLTHPLPSLTHTLIHTPSPSRLYPQVLLVHVLVRGAFRGGVQSREGAAKPRGAARRASCDVHDCALSIGHALPL